MGIWLEELTLALLTPMVDAGAGHQNIMDNRKRAFTAYPLPVDISDAGIVQRRSFVHENIASVNIAGKWDFLGMEIVEARSTFNIPRLVA